MDKGRLEAFTDGVVAIIITIMVLDLKLPARPDLASFIATAPTLAGYALSYVNVGIFWNNHHHMLHATRRINGTVLWMNLLLLFALSLVPFDIKWMGESGFAALPTAAYGVVLVMASASYGLLERAIIRADPANASLAEAVGSDRKGGLSLLIYALAIPLAFVDPWIAVGLYALVAAMWFIPDRRIESRLKA
jgi:uncharacterized membrane protein